VTGAATLGRSRCAADRPKCRSSRDDTAPGPPRHREVARLRRGASGPRAGRVERPLDLGETVGARATSRGSLRRPGGRSEGPAGSGHRGAVPPLECRYPRSSCPGALPWRGFLGQTPGEEIAAGQVGLTAQRGRGTPFGGRPLPGGNGPLYQADSPAAPLVARRRAVTARGATYGFSRGRFDIPPSECRRTRQSSWPPPSAHHAPRQRITAPTSHDSNATSAAVTSDVREPFRVGVSPDTSVGLRSLPHRGAVRIRSPRMETATLTYTVRPSRDRPAAAPLGPASAALRDLVRSRASRQMLARSAARPVVVQVTCRSGLDGDSSARGRSYRRRRTAPVVVIPAPRRDWWTRPLIPREAAAVREHRALLRRGSDARFRPGGDRCRSALPSHGVAWGPDLRARDLAVKGHSRARDRARARGVRSGAARAGAVLAVHHKCCGATLGAWASPAGASAASHPASGAEVCCAGTTTRGRGAARGPGGGSTADLCTRTRGGRPSSSLRTIGRRRCTSLLPVGAQSRRFRASDTTRSRGLERHTAETTSHS